MRAILIGVAATLLLEAKLWWGHRRYTLCLKLDRCGFICDSVSSLCPLCNTTWVAWGPAQPSPFPDSSGPQSTTAGSAVKGRGGAAGVSNRPEPIRAGRFRSSACAVTIQLNRSVCSGVIRTGPNTSWAIKGIGWAIGALSVSGKRKHIHSAPPLRAVRIKTSTTEGGRINSQLAKTGLCVAAGSGVSQQDSTCATSAALM